MYVLVSMKSLHPHYEIYRTVICSILPLNYLDRVSVYICQVTDKSLHNETRLSRCLDQSFYSCTNILTKKQVEEERVYSAYTSTLLLIIKEARTGTQAGQEAGADVEAMEGCYLLDCFLWLAQLAFL